MDFGRHDILMGKKRAGPVTGTLDRIVQYLSQDVWRIHMKDLPWWKRSYYRVARIGYLAVHGLLKNDCLQLSSALTYITVLSIVPLLALAFSVAQGFGAYDYLENVVINPWLEHAFGADGESQAPELRSAIDRILAFVSRTNFKNLGLLGLVFVIFTAVKLLTSVESVFNQIWGVKRSRSIVRKITDYVALVVITPVLLITATTLTTAARSNAIVDLLRDDLGLGPVLSIAFKLLPLVALWVGFGFLYMAMPNTRVSLGSAIVGGVLGGTLWQVILILHVSFQVGVARYNEIYAGFAALPIFLIWVYFSWVTILLGAQLAWAHQSEPEYQEAMRDAPDTQAGREFLAVQATVMVARAFSEGAGVVTNTHLAAQLAVPPWAISEALSPLVSCEVLTLTDADQDVGYVPARDLTSIRLQALLEMVRGVGVEASPDGDEIESILRELRVDASSSSHNLTLQEILDRVDRPEAT